MQRRKERLEEVLGFIRENRSNESNFETLYAKLEEECAVANTNDTGNESSYLSNLNETKEKHADVYRKAKEQKSSAWPEFENFVSEFETSVTEEIRGLKEMTNDSNSPEADKFE